MGTERIYSDAQLVDPSKVTPNAYNPNIMTNEQFDSLVADFRENGWIGQPVIVNQKFEIIDGYHRWKAATSLGFEKIPVVVFTPTNENHQKIVTIALNAKRGEMNPMKLAALVTELNQTYSVEELSTKLGFSVSDLKDKLSLTQITREFVEKLRKESDEQNRKITRVLNFAVTLEQEGVILEALEAFPGTSRGEKLAALCSAYIKPEQKDGTV